MPDRPSRSPALPSPPARWQRLLPTAALLLMLGAGGCIGPRPRLAIVDAGGLRLAGQSTQAGCVFLGVPYAEPPTGARRWREPEPWPASDGIQSAERGLAGRSPEDLLRLDLFTPPAGTGPHPLCVWFADDGDAEQRTLDGSALAATGLCVAIVHTRHGALATFAHPALEQQRPGAPANFGLLDALAALRWCGERAPAFGADPLRITIAGRGRAATTVLWLLQNPQARGRFQRALVVDPEPIRAAPSRAGAVAAGRDLLAAADLRPSTTANDLRALPASRLLALPLQGTPLAQPLLDGVTLAEPLLLALAQRASGAVPLLIGSTGPVAVDAPLETAAFARWLARTLPGPTWLFRHALPPADPSAGVAAAWQQALFAPLASGQGGDAAATERWLGSIVRDYVAAFVRDGVPRAANAPAWLPYDATSDTTLCLQAPITAVPRLLALQLDAATERLVHAATPPR